MGNPFAVGCGREIHSCLDRVFCGGFQLHVGGRIVMGIVIRSCSMADGYYDEMVVRLLSYQKVFVGFLCSFKGSCLHRQRGRILTSMASNK